MPATHTVTNQVPPLLDIDVAAADPALHAGLAAAGTAWDGTLTGLGQAAGSAELQEAARLANENGPRLRTHDAGGNRIDEVEYHPAYHTLMQHAVGYGLHAAPWGPEAGEHAHVRRAAGFYAWNHTDSGHLCPVSMTYAAIPALRHEPAVAARYEPGLRSPVYDFGLRPASTKRGLLAGMSMTEKQGGSDVQANTTRAEPDDGPAGQTRRYRLTGHKWFTSAPMNDVFLTLAQSSAGLTCFAVPRVLDDGSRNAISAAATEGQAGKPVERILGDRVRRRGRIPGRGRGSGRADDHRDGHDDPTGLRARVGRSSQGRALPRHPSRGASGRVRSEACRPTSHDGGARRSGGGELGGHPHRAPARPGGGHRQRDDARPERRRRGRVLASRAPVGQVLGMQARRSDNRRGAGMPGRQWICRGIRDAAAVARVAAERDLGRIGNGHGARRRSVPWPARPTRWTPSGPRSPARLTIRPSQPRWPGSTWSRRSPTRHTPAGSPHSSRG